jgi:hypothetical protein
VPILVVADADTLFGATTRGLLIHLDYAGVMRLHWSALILDEMSNALVAEGRKPDLASARAHERLMQISLPHADVPVADVQAQFAAVAPAMRSAKDVHVAACARALLANAYYPGTPVVSLVTRNVRDFKVTQLAAINIDVKRPDVFLGELVGSQPQAVARAFRALRLSLRSGPAPDALLQRLAADGQINTAAALAAVADEGLLRL